MADFFQQLTPDERRLFNELMGVRDVHGNLLKTADEYATDLLKAFVVKHGKLDPDVAERLGGQPPYGRADIVLDLVRALTGPHPIPQAWLDVERQCGFGLFKPSFYRPRSKGEAEPEIGSPGVYLQRMLAQYRDGVNSYRVSRVSNAALYTETAMLTLVMVCRDLEKAVGAKLALGPAWVVGLAVNPLEPKVKRQMDALAGNQAYIDALGRAVEAVTATYATPDLKERSTLDVEHSLPPGAELDAFFAGHDLRQLEATVDALVAAVEYRIQNGERVASAAVNKAVDRLIELVAEMPLDPDMLTARVEAATRYLDEPRVMSEADLADHHQRLRLLMPDLTSERSRADRGARVLLSANTYLHAGDQGSPKLLGDAKSDALFKGIASRINSYAIKVGPPPPGTPLEHIPVFEAAANMAFTTGYRDWPARQQWHDAGLLPADMPRISDLAGPIISLIDEGVEGLDVTAARDLFRRLP